MHTEHLSFRASPVLAAALYSRAREAGYSVSEYLRAIARERVGLEAPASACDDGRDAPVDAFRLLRLAAAGDLAAQRALADRALDCAANPPEGYGVEVGLIEGAVFARMAAAHGDANDHERCIAFALEIASRNGGQFDHDLLAETFARLELMADSGHEEAAMELAKDAALVPASILRTAQTFRARMAKSEENK